MKKYFILLLVFISPLHAHAVFEFRAHYNFLTYSPTQMNSNWTGGGQLKLAAGYGADVIYSVWAGRIPIGLRYDSLSEDRSAGGFNRSADYSVTQALLGYRFFLTGKGYLGALATLPLSGKAKYSDGIGQFKAESTTFSGGTLGLEAALRIHDNYTLEVEGGLSILKAEDFKSGGGVATYNSKKMEVDMDGSYYRAVFGLMF